MAARVAVLVTLAVVIAATLMACDRFSTFERVGVSLDGHSIVINYPGCDYERIAAVHLYAVNDEDDEEDDELLWELRADEDSQGGVFVVGKAHEGYTEVVPFTQGIDEDELLSAWVESSAIGGAISFRLSDLEPDKVWVIDDTNVTANAFEERAQATCRRAS